MVAAHLERLFAPYAELGWKLEDGVSLDDLADEHYAEMLEWDDAPRYFFDRLGQTLPGPPERRICARVYRTSAEIIGAPADYESLIRAVLSTTRGALTLDGFEAREQGEGDHRRIILDLRVGGRDLHWQLDQPSRFISDDFMGLIGELPTAFGLEDRFVAQLSRGYQDHTYACVSPAERDALDRIPSLEIAWLVSA